MTTLVFRANSGPLTQVQIGPADVLATFAAAYTASGWLGGLDGIRSLLSRSSQFFSASSKAKQDQLLQRLFRDELKLQNAVFHILTSVHGPVHCEIPISQSAFGGERITKIIGFTICALAHEGGYDTAVTLFTEYFAPLLFDGAAELLGALQSQLRENTTMHRLTNEGVTLGLPAIFLNVPQSLGLPAGDGGWLRDPFDMTDTDLGPSEWNFVIGLLRWLGSGMKTVYLTRSCLVARVAGYLQAVGYGIESILPWQGSPPRPRGPNSRAVLLVLGGSEETDTLMEEHFELRSFDVIMHYTYNTVGAMLHQSMFAYTDTPQKKPGASINDDGSLCVDCRWEPSSSTTRPIATRLAAIYFPLLTEHVAPCYESIATSTILQSVKDREQRDASGPDEQVTQDIVLFREYTASILISLIASLSRDDFRNFKHAIRLDLSHVDDLERACRFVDRSFSSSIEFNEAVRLLATIHAARSFEFNDEDSSFIVGWRYGIYCVIPNILLDMKPTAESITLACHDVFYANIRVHEDGSIKSATTTIMFSDTTYSEDPTVPGAELPVIEISQHPWVGRAQTTPPNRLLYLALERTLNYNEPDICFVGRVDGTVVGSVSVLDVLKGVAHSLSQPPECSHNGGVAIDVLNVQTSTWINKRRSVPVGTIETPALLAVKDDPSWALFAIGQSARLNSSLVVRCLSCALHAATATDQKWNVVLIGYR
ncbi:hypothetical protein ACLOAV_007548 [Pseudogymnoascus australis]